MGYRAFFILIDELQGLITAVRLRGGVSGTLREQLSTYGKMLGVLVIHSADMTDTNVPGDASKRLLKTDSQHAQASAFRGLKTWCCLHIPHLSCWGVFLYR